MRLKKLLYILSPLVCLAACQRQPISGPIPPTVEPSISGLETVEIDQPTADSIRSHMSPFLKSNPYYEYESGSQLLQYLVSSGEFDQAKITLASGETYQADVLYAYALMESQIVLVAPVLVGLSLPDERYIYFSGKFAFQSNAGITTTDVDRPTALADTQERLPRGRIFRLLAYGMATRQGPDWKKCPFISFYPPEICPVGELVEQLTPHQTRSFVLRLADGFPTNWLLIGWVFQEFASEELVPGASLDVPLPGPFQP